MIDSTNVETIVFDLDRTLLHTDKTISSYSIKVLQECKNRGIKIMVATARPLRTTTQYSELIDFDAMVVSNGARIIYNNQQTNDYINFESAKHMLSTFKCYPHLRITLETGDCAYSNLPIEDYETILCDDLVDVAKREGVLKLLVHLDTEDALDIVKSTLNDDVYYTVAHGYLLQIMNNTATKWNGIKTMLDICNCSVDKTIYFGDDQDDIEPLSMCGVGVAVSNGINEAKSVADYITETNDEDGVAKFIKNMILKEL